MTPTEYIKWISEDLYFVKYKDEVFLLDASHIGDPSWDFGIYSHMNAYAMQNGRFDDDYVPDVVTDPKFQSLLNDGLPNRYHVPQDILDQLEHELYMDWYEILKDAGYEVDELKDICAIYSMDACFDGETITYAGSSNDIDCIKKYIDRYPNYLHIL